MLRKRASTSGRIAAESREPGTSRKTLLQLKAAANQRVHVKEWSVSFDGTSNTAEPIEVEIVRQESDGTMTAFNPQKMNDSDDETLQTQAQHTATVEPDGSSAAEDEIMGEHVHPQGGYTWQAPFGGDIVIPGGGWLGLVVTAAAAVDAKARFVFEE